MASTSFEQVAALRVLHAQRDLEIALKYGYERPLKAGDLEPEVKALRTAIEALINVR